MNARVRGPALRPLRRSSAEPIRLPETAMEFLRRLRGGVEAGLDPALAAERAANSLPQRLRHSVERMGERMRGEYVEDEWGFDEEFAEAAYPFFELLYSRWWQVETTGLTNVPSHGRAMLVSDHGSDLFPFEAAMVTAAVMKEHPLPRWPRALVPSRAFEFPYLSVFMRRVGGVPASPQNAERLLEQNHLVTAFPAGRAFGEYTEVAQRTESPLIPVTLAGANSPSLGSLGALASPSSWTIEFGAPVDPGEHERIRETIRGSSR